MKTLILIATVILGCVSIYAITEATSAKAKSEADLKMTYRQVSIENVPAMVKASLETAYSDAKLTKAYVNEKKEYKLELSVGNQKATVYTDVNGNW